MSNFCYHYQNLLQFTKITTRIHVFWPCLKLHNWCFWSNSTLLSFCAPYRCKHKCLWGICFYSDMEHRHGRQARRSFCSQYRCKTNYPKKIRADGKCSHKLHKTGRKASIEATINDKSFLTTSPTTFVQRQKSKFPPYVNFFRVFATFTRQICSKESKNFQFIWRKTRLVTLLSALSLMYSVTNITFLCVHLFRFGLLSYSFGYIWKVVHFWVTCLFG